MHLMQQWICMISECSAGLDLVSQCGWPSIGSVGGQFVCFAVASSLQAFSLRFIIGSHVLLSLSPALCKLFRFVASRAGFPCNPTLRDSDMMAFHMEPEPKKLKLSGEAAVQGVQDGAGDRGDHAFAALFMELPGGGSIFDRFPGKEPASRCSVMCKTSTGSPASPR
jgi:hypothetical protein